MSPIKRHVRRAALVLAASLAVGGLAGCARQAEFTLRQPFAPPAQQNLHLTGQWAYTSARATGQSTALSFALPGAVDGPRAFVVYIATPRATGDFPVAVTAPQAARGFLIQELGTLAGRSDLVSGTARLHDVLGAPRVKKLDLDVHTADGAALHGTAWVEELPREMNVFEREFSADIAQLMSTAPELASDEMPLEPGDATPEDAAVTPGAAAP
jgi:hypothetical protein